MKNYAALNDRVGFIDELRGLSILLMVIYHLGYDLVYIFGFSIPFFESAALNFLRDFFAGIFVFISGVCCRFSHSNAKRGIICLGCALLLTIVSFLFVPDEVIWFGILHLLGVSMLLFSLLKPLLDRIFSPIFGAGLFGVIFILLYQIPMGKIGWIHLPDNLYCCDFLAPVGLPPANFFSADYFPLIPWLFLFIAGSYFGVIVKNKKLPGYIYSSHCDFLAASGRHTLVIYLLHQPIIYGILTLAFS